VTNKKIIPDYDYLIVVLELKEYLKTRGSLLRYGARQRHCVVTSGYSLHEDCMHDCPLGILTRLPCARYAVVDTLTLT